MREEEIRLSRAAPGQPVWYRCLLGTTALVVSLLVAGSVPGAAGTDPPAGAVPAMVGVVLLTGGVLAARLLRPRLSLAGIAGTLSLPIPIALATWMFMLGLSEADPAVGAIAGSVIAIWEVALIVSIVFMAVRRQRAVRSLEGTAWAPSDLEIAQTTALGTADIVVREYPDTPFGRTQFTADRAVFAEHGYSVVGFEQWAGMTPPSTLLDLVSPIPLTELGPSSDPSVVATFARGQSATPSSAGRPRQRSADLACRKPGGRAPS